jgi:hypothetical protein
MTGIITHQDLPFPLRELKTAYPKCIYLDRVDWKLKNMCALPPLLTRAAHLKDSTLDFYHVAPNAVGDRFTHMISLNDKMYTGYTFHHPIVV